ncbi:MAG: TPM domain-containing protein [Schleiferilactobacillus harbinensis]|jgi:uncharacterized membrane protein YgcG|nr:TPM domain-containing protein [Schleiferilactobacillus harbinensis]MCI1913066.1 TPM domain-containing protein [Schleiferilactobacillus harbinensis]
MIPVPAVNNTHKRWRAVWLGLAALLFFIGGIHTVQAAALPTTAPANGVVDTADIVTAPVTKRLTDKNAVYARRSAKVQILLVTVPKDASLKKTQAFVIQHYLPAHSHRIALLYAVNNGKPAARIVPSGAMTSFLSRAVLDRVLTDAIPQLRSRQPDKLNTGFLKVVNSLSTLIDQHYRYPVDQQNVSQKKVNELLYGRRDNLFTPRGMLVLVAVMAVLFLFPGRRRDASGRLRPWWAGTKLDQPDPDNDEEQDEKKD